MDPTCRGLPFEVLRLEAEEWIHEKLRIEQQAEDNDFSLEDPDVVRR